jgi:ribonuclease BN (tRNA processing enzyme)
VAIVAEDRPYLVDFGPGVVRRAAAANEAGVEGLAVERLTRAFLTHLHSDHSAGYADLILTPWVLERDEPLHVYGPPGLAEMTESLLAAYRHDIRERIEGLEPANERGYQTIAHEIEPGTVYRDDNLTVDAFQVRHGSWAALGYRFQTQKRTIVVSGDTAPSDEIVAQSRGCDLLLHEVYSAVRFAGLPAAWQRYHAQVHTSTRELARLADRAQPSLLVLYHQLFWGASEQELVDEVKEQYAGPIVSGRDLDVY